VLSALGLLMREGVYSLHPSLPRTPSFQWGDWVFCWRPVLGFQRFALYNFAFVSFSVSVCPSVLTMSFPAPCADSARPPGMLTCNTVLLSLLKKSGKVFITLCPRVPPPWPATLRRQVFDDAIKIAMSLLVCFLQKRFHHRWQPMAPFSYRKSSQKVPEALPGC
jgi:hypothetical protein